MFTTHLTMAQSITLLVFAWLAGVLIGGAWRTIRMWFVGWVS